MNQQPEEAVQTAFQLETPTLYFEDLVPGMRSTSAGRTITEADIVAFAGLSGDYNQLHVDREFAENSAHGGRIAHGLLVLAVLSGLSTRVPLMQGLGDSIVGLAGLECRWKKPVHIGDTLNARLEISKLRRTSKGDKGIVVIDRDAVNQDGDVVMESIWTLMVRCRSAGNSA